MLEANRGSLVDRGANGGILGNDAVVIYKHQHTLNVTGIDNHQITGLTVVDASAKVTTQRGPAIVILRQYAYHGLNRSIHSCIQIEAYKNKVNDRAIQAGGSQCIVTVDGYVLPLNIYNGLPYLEMTPNTVQEAEDLPTFYLTPDGLWNTKIYDFALSQQPDWYNLIKDMDAPTYKAPFDEYGNYKHREPDTSPTEGPPTYRGDTLDIPNESDEPTPLEVSRSSLISAYHILVTLNQPELLVFDADLDDSTIEAGRELQVKKKPIDYDLYRPYLLGVPREKVRKTFENTTQFATNVMAGSKIQQTRQSPYPALNVHRRNEPVATDTFFSEVPAIDTNGQKHAQFYVGRKSLVIDIYGMSSKAQFVNTLLDIIRDRGAPSLLISDGDQVQISQRVIDVCRALHIKNWQSEAQYQYQNAAERRWKHCKHNIQWYMNYRNVDPSAWLLCAQWVADVMNHTAEKSLDWRPPLEVLTGQTIDISIILCFLFWDVVYVTRYHDQEYHGQVGSKKSSEIRGRFVGFAHTVGHALTFKVLTDDTKKVIKRSRLRLGKDGENNLRLDVEAGAVPERVYIRSKRSEEGDNVVLPTIDMATNPFTLDGDVPTLPAPTPTSGQDSDIPTSEQDSDTPTSEQASDTPTLGQDSDVPTLEKGETNTPAPQPTHRYPTRSRRSVHNVETVDDDEDEEIDRKTLFPDPHTPMDDPALKDKPEVTTVDEDEFLAPHNRARREPGASNPSNEPYDFSTDTLRTHNPTDHGLTPDEMIDRTFLMPPTEDGTRVCAKIVKRVQALRDEAHHQPEMIKFKCIVDNDYEEVVSLQ